MTDRRLRAPITLIAAAMLAVGPGAGCDILNPSLLASLGINTTWDLDAPTGDIVILLLNQSAESAVVRLDIVKGNEANVELVVGLQPSGDAGGRDHIMVVQKCDVQSVQVLGVTLSAEVGDAQEIPSDSPAITMGDTLYCGKVIAIVVRGGGLPPDITVY